MSDERDNSVQANADALLHRIEALRRSAASMVQMDLDQLAARLPPGTPRERVLEIRGKIMQLHVLQNSRRSYADYYRDPPQDSHQDSDAAGPSADWPTSHRSSRYKTELCRPFEEDGVCKYGARCQFAHGTMELRNLPRHPKYKSQLCRTFHSNGLCPYGHRCHFIHNQDEASEDMPPGPGEGEAQANPTRNEFNMNNVPESLINGWSSQPNFPNYGYDVMRQNMWNPVVQSYMPVPGATTASMMAPPGMPAFNGNKPLPAGSGLGSVAELTPPISPLIFSTEEGFVSQTPIRQGYYPANRPEEFPALDLNDMMAQMKVSDSRPGSSGQASARTSLSESGGNSLTSNSPLGRDDLPW